MYRQIAENYLGRFVVYSEDGERKLLDVFKKGDGKFYSPKPSASNPGFVIPVIEIEHRLSKRRELLVPKQR